MYRKVSSACPTAQKPKDAEQRYAGLFKSSCEGVKSVRTPLWPALGACITHGEHHYPDKEVVL